MKIKSFLNKNILRSKVICGVFGAFVAILGFGMLDAPAGAVELPENILNDRGNVSEQVKYLSDMEYSKASVGWGTLTFDKTQDNASLILRVDGYSTAFRKGIWAHATSTIEYDLSNYSDFAYFTTYYGLNTTSQAGNGVKFYIYTSTDGENWTLRTEENPEALKGASNAKFAKIDIRGAKYLRLYADAFGSNASDHAVWADSKLIKEGYTDEITIPVATLTGSKPNMTVLSDDVPVATNPDGSRTITFEENDSVEVVFQDAVGNVGRKTITVDWIDKTAPTAEISYSTLHLTDEPVTAEMTPSEEVTILNNDGSPIYTFNDNGEFTFEFVDKAGNVGTATAIVSWIARMPEYTLEYSTTEPTRDDVEVVLTLEDDYRVVNNDGSNKYLFTENGTFGFQYIDGSGIVGQIDATVDWIDREAPTAELEYIKTRDLVTVKVVNPSEEITFAEGDGTYEYTENGEYEIVFYDRAGNEGRLMAVVDSIGKDPEEPDPGEDPNPEEPGPEEPEEPEEPSTPDDSNQGGNNNGGNANGGNGGFGGWTGSGVGGGADEEVKVEDEGEEKVYTLGNIKVAVPAGAVVEGGSMKVGSFEPVEGLRYAFGRGSEYYDFYFINDKLERTRLAAETVTIRFPKSKTKELIGVFTVTEGNTMDTVDYTVEGDEIVVTLKGLSKVVVSYDAEEVAATPEEEEGNNPVAVWAVAGVVMVVLVMAYYGFIERRAKARKR